jgi:ankyrin repeat protein
MSESRDVPAGTNPHPANLNDLAQLRKQAKELLRAATAGDAAALARFRAAHPGWMKDSNPSPKLADAQWVIARELGIESWPKLKLAAEQLRRDRDGNAAVFVEACMTGDAARAAALIDADPAVASHDLACALCAANVDFVRDAIEDDPTSATALLTRRNLPPILVATRTIRLRDSASAERAVEIVRLLVAAGADPNVAAPFDPPYHTSDGRPLYYAAGFHGSLPLSRALIELGANPDRPPDGETLYHCVEHGNGELLRLVIGRAASKPWRSYCVLHLLDYEWPEGLRIFLDSGIDLAHRHPQRGETALHWAIKHGRSRRVVEQLLDAGADPLLPDHHGVTPYAIAIHAAHDGATDAIEARGVKPPLGPREALLRAATQSDEAFDAVRKQFGDAARLQDADGELACLLVRAARADVLRRLLAAGLPPSAYNSWGHTALHWACVTARPDLVEVLLNAGAKPDVRDREHNAVPAGWAAWGSMNWPHRPQADYARCVELIGEAGGPMPENEWGSPEVLAARTKFLKG